MTTDHGTDAREEIVRGAAYFLGSTMTVSWPSLAHCCPRVTLPPTHLPFAIY
jgi:hypothetical protein